MTKKLCSIILIIFFIAACSNEQVSEKKQEVTQAPQAPSEKKNQGIESDTTQQEGRSYTTNPQAQDTGRQDNIFGGYRLGR